MMKSKLTKHLIDFSKKKLTHPETDNRRTFLIFISGFLTLFLSLVVPVAGGGASLVFILTIPILIGLAIIFSMIHHFVIRKLKVRRTKNSIFRVLLYSLIGLAFLVYPYA